MVNTGGERFADEGEGVEKTTRAEALDTPPFHAFVSRAGSPLRSVECISRLPVGVLDVDDAPIPGLYAAGDMVGGLFYGNYPGGSGLASAAVVGRLAGYAAATDP